MRWRKGLLRLKAGNAIVKLAHDVITGRCLPGHKLGLAFGQSVQQIGWSVGVVLIVHLAMVSPFGP
jgi:hypothetical protein